MSTICVVIWGATLGVVTAIGTASGQEYPNRTIRIITGNVGSGNDFAARQISQAITGPLGQPVIVDNRQGGIIAAEAAAKVPPDGYTLLVAGESLWVLPLTQKVAYEINDFSPVVIVTKEVRVISVHPTVPAKSIRELIALAKANPGQLNYASSGTRATSHLAGELFKSIAGVNIVHVPYKGITPAITALISGEVHMSISDVAAVMPQVKLGKLRALAVTSVEPSALVPTLPTATASGLPGFSSVGMTSMWAPAKTPTLIINRLNQESVRFLSRPDVKEKFFNAGVEIVGGSPEQFAATMKDDMARWRKVINDAGIKAD